MPPNVETGKELPAFDCDEKNPTQQNFRWTFPASMKSMRTMNPVRAIVDPIVASSVKCGKERGDGKDQISLALGDPSAYPNLPALPPLIESAARSAQSSHTRGYVNACGSPAAREAIAHFHSSSSSASTAQNRKRHKSNTIDPDDVIIANGCSGALELAVTAILDEGTCLLVPRPGFPLYRVIAESHGGYVKYYDLVSSNDGDDDCFSRDAGWKCNLESMENAILEEGDKVRGIVINNPSNPCGSVFSEDHLRDIAALAEKYRLVIVSDEVYGNMTFGEVFHPMGDVAGGTVPVITASGLGKQFLVPGWRVGWLVIYDCEGKPLRDVKKGIQNLAQVILGASHLAQDALVSILNPATITLRTEIDKWRENLNGLLKSQSEVTFTYLSKCHGLAPIQSCGAMYTMVKIHFDCFEDIQDDFQFTKMLLKEENVFCLPGACFDAEGYFRVVYCAPEEVLKAAFGRVDEFCERHAARGNK